MAHGVWPARTTGALTIVATAFGQQIVNVHHFQITAAGDLLTTTDALAQGWMTLVMGDWLGAPKTAWLATHPSDYVISLVKAQVLERPGQLNRKLTSTENPLSSGNVGTVGTSTGNTIDCANLKWKTTVAGKSSRGRTYISPITTNWQASGLLNPTGQTAVNAYATAMLNMFGPSGTTANNARLTIYSRPYDQGEYQYTVREGGNIVIKIPEDYDGAATDVTVGVCDPVVRTQRRRQVGVGS